MTTDCSTEDCSGDAFTYEAVLALWDEYGPYWDEYVVPNWEEFVVPLIKQYGDYGVAGGLATFAVGNMVYTYLNSTGTNQIAVFVNMAKGILADQPLPGGLTLYGVFDMIIEWTSNAE